MEAPDMLRAAIYGRVSSEEQAQHGYGLASQVTELRALAARKSYRIVGEFCDEGWSGADLDRPDLTALRELVRSRSLDVLLVHAADRLSRKLSHLLLLRDECRRAGVQLEYASHTPLDSPEGRLLDSIEGAVAEYEREKIRERTARGKREKARRGLVPGGRVPYGYQLNPNGRGGYALPDRAAEVVRRLYAGLLEGASLRQLALRLNAQDVPSPQGRCWTATTIRQILTRELYAGTTYWNRIRSPEGGRGVRGLRDPGEWIAIETTAIVDRAHAGPTATQCHAARRSTDRDADVAAGAPRLRRLWSPATSLGRARPGVLSL
jgi:site-specific DNA recombinase